MKKDLYNQNDYEWWANSAIRSARRIVPILIKSFDFSSVVDFGCAQGGWLSVFQEQGIEEIQGIDGDWVDPQKLIIPEICFRCVDLSSYDHDPAEKYDLALCLEVAEHMEDKFSDQLIDNLAKSSDIILFSAAVPDQGGQHHVNERPPEYWKEKFHARGFEQQDWLRPHFWGDQEIAWWYRQNIMLYLKGSSNKPVTNRRSGFGGAHLIHPTAFEEKNRELGLDNASLRNLCLEATQKACNKLKKIFSR